jgi:hypothetical protein
MLLALWTRLARVPVTLAYAVILLCVYTTLLALGPAVHDRVIQDASTNLHNLSRGHVGTLFTSAFVVDTSPIAAWLPMLVCLMGLAELLWRSGRLVVAFTVGHVGATLVVAAALTMAVELRWLPAASVTRATDVGMSYGAIAVVGVLTAAIPRRWRPCWIGWWLAAGVAVVAATHDFTDAGHVVALVLGMLVATRFGRPMPWTAGRVALLGVASLFGYLILADTWPLTMIAAGSGALGAAAGTALLLIRHEGVSGIR